MRSWIGIRDAGSRTHQRAAEIAQSIRLHIQEHHHAPTLLHRFAHALEHPFLKIFIRFRAHHEFIHNDLYRMVLIAIQAHAMQNLLDFPIDAHIQIPFSANLIK